MKHIKSFRFISTFIVMMMYLSLLIFTSLRNPINIIIVTILWAICMLVEGIISHHKKKKE